MARYFSRFTGREVEAFQFLGNEVVPEMIVNQDRQVFVTTPFGETREVKYGDFIISAADPTQNQERRFEVVSAEQFAGEFGLIPSGHQVVPEESVQKPKVELHEREVTAQEVTHLFEGPPDARQGDENVKTSLFRPRYRGLTREEKAIHDAVKSKAEELHELLQDIAVKNPDSDYNRRAEESLELAVMWAVKSLTQ